jgi:cell wall-associated NlpC family hydrolase
VVTAAVTGFAAVVLAVPALAATSGPPAAYPPARSAVAERAIDWAVTQQGAWYCWGGTAGCYDCSGLVWAAYHHAGINLPRTTYGMLASGHLVRTFTPHRGDLAFYGSGHVELLTKWWHATFGALDFGTRVGRHHWSGWWTPTAFYYVR